MLAGNVDHVNDVVPSLNFDPMCIDGSWKKGRGEDSGLETQYGQMEVKRA